MNGISYTHSKVSVINPQGKILLQAKPSPIPREWTKCRTSVSRRDEYDTEIACGGNPNPAVDEDGWVDAGLLKCEGVEFLGEQLDNETRSIFC